MDQVKTGKFISELRREKELTQSGLADIIGVSAKTVSKWECGRGMPEISTLPGLCETLGISVNELLSGERLPEESYTEHAEENMVTLLKDSKTYNKDRSVLGIAAPIVAFTAAVLLIIQSWGQEQYAWFIDLPTILYIFVITTVFLIASGCYGDLWRAFGYAAGFGSPTREKLSDTLTAVTLAGKTMLVSGAVIALISAVIALMLFIDIDDFLCAMALVPVEFLYGLAGYLLSLPIKARLQRRINRLA